MERTLVNDLSRVKRAGLPRQVWGGMAAVALSAAVALVGAAGASAAHGPERGPSLDGHKASRFDFPRPRVQHRTLLVVGSEAADKIALRLEAGRPDVLQVDEGDDGSADFSFRRDKIETILVVARGGDDSVRIDDSNGSVTADIRTVIAGGDGNDTLSGGSSSELLLGGDGNDSIDGNGGNDAAFLGAGDDRFIWDPGDGSDSIEGQDGNDTMVFNGAAAAEQVTLTANGNHLTFFRNPGNITMDTHGVENVDFNALGGADQVTVNDLTGTDVTSVDVDLANTLGGTTGDAAADRVIVNGTNRNDTVNVAGDAGGVKASGLAATVEVLHSEAANDRLEINTLAGSDTVDSSGLAAGAIQLLVNGVPVS
jgi:Ca2+-binding RTX toxin-like protein